MGKCFFFHKYPCSVFPENRQNFIFIQILSYTLMMVTLCVALLIYFADKNIIPTLVIRVVKWQIDSISLDYCLILKHGHTIWFYVYRLRCAQTLFDQADFFYLKCMKNIKLQWPTCRQYLRYSRKKLVPVFMFGEQVLSRSPPLEKIINTFSTNKADWLNQPVIDSLK